MTELILKETDDRGITTLTLNRAEVRNALNDEIVLELHEHLTELDKDANARVVIITGSGKSFCSGADLSHMRKLFAEGFESNLADAKNVVDMLHTLEHLSKPTIARINGSAYGGGLGIIAACDLAVASSNATFTFSEVRLGILPAAIAPYVLSCMGERSTRMAMLCAEPFDASTAVEWNLIDCHCDESELDKKVQTWAESLLLGSPYALSGCKQMLARLLEVDHATRNWTAKLNAEMRLSVEGQEGISAFLERRKPQWQL